MSGLRSAFTLVELLVVLAIIGLLVALLLPAVQAARESSRRTSCQNNMKQVGVALHAFHDAHHRLPAGWLAHDPATGRPDVEGAPGWGWAAKILAQMEQHALCDQVQLNRPVGDPIHDAARIRTVVSFRCPSDAPQELLFDLLAEDGTGPLAALATANYVGSFGTLELEDCEGLPLGQICRSDGPFHHNSRTNFRDMLDGLSQTFLVGERFSLHGHSTWVGVVPGGEEAFSRVLGVADHTPNHRDGHFDDFGSYHPGGCQFTLGDGSVRFISESISLPVYRALSTRAGGEVVPAF